MGGDSKVMMKRVVDEKTKAGGAGRVGKVNIGEKQM